MAPKSKSRRGGKKGKAKAAEQASSNGSSGLTVAEKRLEQDKTSLGDRRKAVKMANGDASISEVADFIGLTPNKTKYLLMQQQVEDGDVPKISPTNENAIVNALKKDGEYNSVAWVACRTELSDGKVKQIAEENGHSFSRGAPRRKAGKSTNGAKASSGKSGSKARRGGKGKKGKRGKVTSPNA